MRESIQIMLLLSKSNPIQSKKDSCLLWFKRFKQCIWILYILWEWSGCLGSMLRKRRYWDLEYNCHTMLVLFGHGCTYRCWLPGACAPPPPFCLQAAPPAAGPRLPYPIGEGSLSSRPADVTLVSMQSVVITKDEDKNNAVMSEILIFLFVFNDYVLMDIGILPDQTKFPMHCKQDHALITLITTKMLRFGVIDLRRRRL